MRLPVRSALSAVVLVMMLLGSACSDQSTIGADAPEADPQEQDRGAAGTPIQPATPTVVSSPDEPDETGEPVETDTAETEDSPDRRPPPQLTALDFGSSIDRGPNFFGPPVILPESTFEVVDYLAKPERTASYIVREETVAPAVARGLTPGGQNVWVALADPSGNVTCPEGQVGTQLGVAPTDGSSPASPARVTGDLPPNITQVHYGPEGHAVLYASCGKYSYAAALAKITADGVLSDIRLLDPALQNSLGVHPPRWEWATESGGRYDFENYGELVVIIPQLGIANSADDANTASDIIITVANAEVVDVWQNPNYLTTQAGYPKATWDGSTLYVRDIPVPRSGPIFALEMQRGYTASGRWVAAAGANGATITNTAWEDESTVWLSDRSVFDLDWSPSGDWLALAGPDGTTLHNVTTQAVVELSNAAAESVHFTPDGTQVISVQADGFETFTFPLATDLPNAFELTPFSSLDSGGLGPIRVGMAVSELEALGIDAEIDGIDGVEVGYCVWVNSPQLLNVSILAEATSPTDATITSVTVWDGPWVTPSALRTGSTEADVLGALGNFITSRPHHYVAGNYLDFMPSDPDDPNGVRFTTNGHEVTSISAGRLDWISLVEACG